MNQARRKRLAAVNMEEIKTLIETLRGKLDDAKVEIEAVKDEEDEAFNNLPESLQQGEQGQKMEEIVNTLDEIISNFDEDFQTIEGAIESFEGMEL